MPQSGVGASAAPSVSVQLSVSCDCTVAGSKFFVRTITYGIVLWFTLRISRYRVIVSCTWFPTEGVDLGTGNSLPSLFTAVSLGMHCLASIAATALCPPIKPSTACSCHQPSSARRQHCISNGRAPMPSLQGSYLACCLPLCRPGQPLKAMSSSLIFGHRRVRGQAARRTHPCGLLLIVRDNDLEGPHCVLGLSCGP